MNYFTTPGTKVIVLKAGLSKIKAMAEVKAQRALGIQAFVWPSATQGMQDVIFYMKGV